MKWACHPTAIGKLCAFANLVWIPKGNQNLIPWFGANLQCGNTVLIDLCASFLCKKLHASCDCAESMAKLHCDSRRVRIDCAFNNIHVIRVMVNDQIIRENKISPVMQKVGSFVGDPVCAGAISQKNLPNFFIPIILRRRGESVNRFTEEPIKAFCWRIGLWMVSLSVIPIGLLKDGKVHKSIPESFECFLQASAWFPTPTACSA
jgi:hypothetical protein